MQVHMCIYIYTHKHLSIKVSEIRIPHHRFDYLGLSSNCSNPVKSVYNILKESRGSTLIGYLGISIFRIQGP